MTTRLTKLLITVAIDATHARKPAVKLAEFRGMLQAVSKNGSNDDLLEIAELLSGAGHPDTWIKA